MPRPKRPWSKERRIRNQPRQPRVLRPPLQTGASFNMDAVKEQVQRAMQAHHGQ